MRRSRISSPPSSSASLIPLTSSHRSTPSCTHRCRWSRRTRATSKMTFAFRLCLKMMSLACAPTLSYATAAPPCLSRLPTASSTSTSSLTIGSTARSRSKAARLSRASTQSCPSAGSGFLARRSCNASSTATTRPSILPTCGAIRAMRAATPSSRRRCATCGECLATSPPRTRRSSSSLSPRARARRCWASSIYNPLSRFSVYRAMAATRRRSWPSSALGGTRRSDCPLPPPALTYSSCPTSSRALCCANGSSTPSAPPRVLSYHDAGCVPGRAQGGRLCSLGLQTLVAPWMWRTDSEIARAALCHLIVSLPPL
mmetsp:Transcript_31114/g.95220  ORF Transcript_31114/g.95220 Transcript_31114/m.95220 type:complete len:314 (-) Transcript_31114:42-983(-)